MGGWLRALAGPPNLSPLPPGPSHGRVGVGAGPWLPCRPLPYPDHPLTLGPGQCGWRCRWGVWGPFRARLVLSLSRFYPSVSSGSIVRPRAARLSYRSRGHKFAPRNAPRSFLSDLFRPRRCPVCCGWLRLILPEWFGVPCFYGEGAYADRKEWWSKALSLAQRSHFRLSWGRTGLWVLGWASPSRPYPPRLALPTPCLCFHELPRRRACDCFGARSGGLPQSITMTATTRSRNLPGGSWLPTAVRRLLGLPHHPPLCLRGWSAWMTQ
ncbi:hypothetical protein GWK47_022611 [Chionoecetes opilio]|uniref:Uncharacterized protein n=1 Tax=Chionoecetes opilio TaxID=41210 RepID=A0A8J5CK36_CHIOP|nr:hypothetical protein GWK47_022611 [Chionoecetes opilio]